MAKNLGTVLHGVARCCTVFSATEGGPWGYRVLESICGGCSDSIDGRHIYISYLEAAGWLSGVEM